MSKRVSRGKGAWRVMALVMMCSFLAQLPVVGVVAQQKEGKQKQEADSKKTRVMVPLSDETLDGLSMLSREVSGITRQTRRDYASKGPQTTGAVLARTGKKSPEKILAWVREHVAFEPYEGALRSPRMVLSMRRANAVDAARLLVALLEEAGHKPSYAWGDLPDKDASVMLLKFGELVQFELRGKGRELDQPVPAALVRRVRDHVWVEVPMKGGEPQALDPFASLDAFNTPARKKGGGERLPATLEASFSAELRVTFEDGREQGFVPIQGSLEDFAHQTLTISFERDDTLTHTTRPVLIRGSELKIGDYFPHEKVERMTLRLGLTTGGYEQLWEQGLYDRGRSANIFAAEQIHIGMTVLPGWVSRGAAAERGGEGFERALTKLDVMLDEQRRHIKKNGAPLLFGEKEYNEQTRALVHDVFNALPYIFAHQLDEMILQLGELMAIQPFLARPRIVTTAMVRDGARVFLDMEILGDSLDGVAARGMPALARQGFVTLYSRVEGEVRSRMLDALATGDVLTTQEIFDAARKGKTPLLTLSAPDTSQASSLKVSKGLEKRLARSVKRQGKVVLTPATEVEISERQSFGWWEIDQVQGWVRGQVARGLLNQPVEGLDEARSLSQSDGFLTLGKLLGKQIGVWLDALGAGYWNDAMICQAADDLEVIGERLCAAPGKKKSLPSLERCLGLEAASSAEDSSKKSSSFGGAAMGDPLGGAGFTRLDCDALAMPARCGTVIANAFLGGQVKVLRGNAFGEFVAAKPNLKCK